MSEANEQIAYLGLGSNMPTIAGDPVETLRAAIRKLRGCVDVLAVSSFYATEPVGYAEQPAFMNAVVRIHTAMPPEDLMRSLLQIEREFGRNRTAMMEKGPRTLDLDLLLMEEIVLTTPLLTLPHPAMTLRRFVLAPLSELAPDLRHPVSGKTMSELLRELPSQGENGPQAVRLMPLHAW